MKSEMLIIVFVIIFCGVHGTTKSGFQNELLEPIVIRNKYFHIEHILWENITVPTSCNDRSKAVIERHNEFVESFIDGKLDITNFMNLAKSNGWKTLQYEVQVIQRMFVSFQELIKTPKHSDDCNKEAIVMKSQVLIRILNDTDWPLTDSIKYLKNIIVNKKLYKSVSF